MKMNLFLITEYRDLNSDSVIKAKERLIEEFPDDNIILLSSEEDLKGTLLAKTIEDYSKQVFAIDKVESWIKTESNSIERIESDINWRLDGANKLLAKLKEAKDDSEAKKERLVKMVYAQPNIFLDEEDDSDDCCEDYDCSVNKKKKSFKSIIKNIFKRNKKT